MKWWRGWVIGGAMARADMKAQPEQVLKDLHTLWAELGKESSTDVSTEGVLRACALTLIVMSREEETGSMRQDADLAREAVGLLMRQHPSRAIIIRPKTRGPEDNDAALSARVFSECWKPLGSSQQICSEGIEISSLSGDMTRLARFLVPLQVPDLPVVLWCRDLGAIYDGRYQPVFDLTLANPGSKIIFDTVGAAVPEQVLEGLRRLVKSGYRVADLHWARLTGWREVISNLFDRTSLTTNEVAAIQVTFAGEETTSCALYLKRWLTHGLPHVPITLACLPEREDGSDEPSGVRQIRFKIHKAADAAHPSGNGAGASDTDSWIEVRYSPRSETDHRERCLVVHGEIGGQTIDSRAILPNGAQASLVHEELSIVGPDPVFTRVLGF